MLIQTFQQLADYKEARGKEKNLVEISYVFSIW